MRAFELLLPRPSGNGETKIELRIHCERVGRDFESWEMGAFDKEEMKSWKNVIGGNGTSTQPYERVLVLFRIFFFVSPAV